MHNAEKACDTSLSNEKYGVHCSEGACDMTSVLVTALGDQREAFALDLGDDQSH